ncbi:helix-turn-helix domain-containing protein [Solihabitans fulvus]|uniref:Helix-turn-helix domain-containing protein n=1 Tax=Solihabitans fulvus TaxID=1892852 RepID=A0A5B2WK71_9PSEU|nr:helix-turn-helix domain-containing protein [Solihabitans fulvus]KAA2252261.1 helix-turn-helix domain-containing protein [Solihabitans fulvus]
MAIRRIELAQVRKVAGYSQESLAEAMRVDRSTVVRWEAGTNDPLPYQQPKLARLLGLDAAALRGLLHPADLLAATSTAIQPWFTPIATEDDELQALELMRRVEASDVGSETLERLESVVDELAVAYPTTSPGVLLGRIRRHLGYLNRLLDARRTLAEHRRLLIVGGWLSLLGATVHIDLNQANAARARLKSASSLAEHAGHEEIRAWCYETEAWRVLTDGDYLRALELSDAARALAPVGSSAAIQAAAQAGRAHARLGQRADTYAAVKEVQRLVSPLSRPDRPEHHYRYDPDKSMAYTATTLAWVSDPAAEEYAREVIRRLSPGDDVSKWPRRVASANIDLSLALLAGNHVDEAACHTLRAIASGRVVPSNQWRAAEVVQTVEAKGLPEAADLREAYEEMRKAGFMDSGRPAVGE